MSVIDRSIHRRERPVNALEAGQNRSEHALTRREEGQFTLESVTASEAARKPRVFSRLIATPRLPCRGSRGGAQQLANLVEQFIELEWLGQELEVVQVPLTLDA